MDRDIFGNEILPPEERRGRPKHKPTSDSRTMVAVLASLHKRHGEIAAALNVSEPTLRKFYRHELDRGSDQIRAEIRFRAMEKVRAGDVSAMKFLTAELDRADVEEARRNFDGAAPPETEAARRGKKEQAAAAAEAAGIGSEWGTDLQFAGGLKPN